VVHQEHGAHGPVTVRALSLVDLEQNLILGHGHVARLARPIEWKSNMPFATLLHATIMMNGVSGVHVPFHAELV